MTDHNGALGPLEQTAPALGSEAATPTLPGLVPIEDFPASTRVFKSDGPVRVPFRRIALASG